METKRSDNQQATPYEVGWLVGVIEGEGSIGLYWNSARKQIAVRLTITNTDKGLIEYASDIMRKLGVNPFIYDHGGKKQMPHWKKRFDIQLEGIKRHKAFLSSLLPFWFPDSIKKQKAEICLAFCSDRLSHPEFHGDPGHAKYTTHEIALYRRMKELCGESSEAKSIPVIEVTEDMVHA